MSLEKLKLISAFTLAEVLIVLGILGILAEMTIPTLIQKSTDMATVAMLKKEVSVLQQAITMAVSEEGPMSSWYDTPEVYAAANPFEAGVVVIGDIISKYLKVTENCGNNSKGCLPSDGYSYLSKKMNGKPTNDETSLMVYKLKLADGSLLAIAIGSAGYVDGKIVFNNLYCQIDTNGLKGPNRWGYDVFRTQTYFAGNRAGMVDPYPAYGNLNACKANQSLGGTGIGCAGWAYYMDNLDYKYCDNLNATTKTNCD